MEMNVGVHSFMCLMFCVVLTLYALHRSASILLICLRLFENKSSVLHYILQGCNHVTRRPCWWSKQ